MPLEFAELLDGPDSSLQNIKKYLYNGEYVCLTAVQTRDKIDSTIVIVAFANNKELIQVHITEIKKTLPM